MPTYDYFCPANGRVVEVFHGMSESISTWNELCERTDTDPGSTPPASPVQKKIGATAVATPKIGEWKKSPAKQKVSVGHRHVPGCGCG